MHPLEKILILMALCQLLTSVYIALHALELHGEKTKIRYLIKVSPLLCATIVLVVLVLRLFHFLPYVGI